MSNLRRADTVGPSLAERIEISSGAQLSIQSLIFEGVEPLVEDYPFSDQQIIRGSFLYDEPSEYTSGREIDVDFEYRSGSQLFILELDTDVRSLDSVVQSLTEAIPQEFIIYRNLHAPEDALWSFLEHADRILEIDILDEGQEVPYDEVEGVPREEVIGNFAIEKAEVGFNVEEHSIMVRYQGGDLQINSDWEYGREYIIQIFEREVLADA
ncbi:hypothetical protein [Haladaptatus halobius]|uniref:hypothetical protein n=1 Tax=Haladaptatus halobius TaxID=2884875 RepID=UPI001D0B1C9E|nr:hypothetical protein [Haladaptatus halobius]